MVQLRANTIDPRNRFWRQHVGVVTYVIGGFGKLIHLLGRGAHGGEPQQDSQQKPENFHKCARKAVHRSQLYADEGAKVPGERLAAGSRMKPDPALARLFPSSRCAPPATSYSSSGRVADYFTKSAHNYFTIMFKRNQAAR
jgi:hypothetical protein